MVFESTYTLLGDIKIFLGYMRRSKVLLIGLIVNVIYLMATSLAFILLWHSGTLGSTIFTKDFQAFYTAGELMRTDAASLFTHSGYDLPFRYLPFFAYMFSWLSYLPLPASYLLNNLGMYIFHWGNIFLLWELCFRIYGISLESDWFKRGFFLAVMAPLQVPNYILGQISELFIFLLLVSVLFFQNVTRRAFTTKYNNVLGGIALGLAITLKPIALIMIPFIFEVSLTKTRVSRPEVPQDRRGFKRFFGLGVALLPSMIIFGLFPNLVLDFINVNLADTLDYHQSTSVTRLIIDLFKFLPIESLRVPLILGITGGLFAIAYWKFLKTPKDSLNYSYFYGLGMLIVMLGYPDSWFLYPLIFYFLHFPSFFALNQLKERPERQKIWILTFVARYLMIYFSIGVVLYYVVLGFDPITPPMLALYFTCYYILHSRLVARTQPAPTVQMIKNNHRDKYVPLDVSNHVQLEHI